MKVYLVRHGHAVDGSADPGRPLSARGEEEVRRLGAFLKGKIPGKRVFHSGKTRARQTAERLIAETGIETPAEVLGGILPMDSPEAFARVLNGWTEDSLVVGHQPFLGSLVSYLVAGNVSMDTVCFQTATVVELTKEEGGRWTIFMVIGPEAL